MKYKEDKKSNGKNHKRTVTATTHSIFNVNMGIPDSEKDQYDDA